MRIVSLRDLDKAKHIFSLDDPSRQIFIVNTKNVQITGRSIHYPNCLLHEQDAAFLINPYDERVMSLKKDSFYENNEYNDQITVASEYDQNEYFFFVYNVDNYFHFIYDSLPILHSYFTLKKTNPSLKLLLQTSHPSKQTLAPFVTEFLELYEVPYEFCKPNTLYSSLAISTSFTHGGQSNDPPSLYCKQIWNSPRTVVSTPLPKRFYVSRRSWIHGNTSNIGTNYTTRRKCMNEDSLVKLLEQYDIQEVFTELLTTQEKLSMFAGAELVVGIIGGGLCNLLFSRASTKSLCIVTPHFLEINKRFEYSMNHTQITYSNTATLFEYEGKFPLYSRVRYTLTGQIGEVEESKEDLCRVTLSRNDVAGFSQDFPMESIWIPSDLLEPVDFGLNSPFTVDLKRLEEDLKTCVQAT